jgi:hypothetical protein
MKKVDLTFKDFLEKFKEFGKGEWIIAYSNYRETEEWYGFYCALITLDRIKRSLLNPSWDLRIGDGLPGHCFSYMHGKEEITYLRFSEEDVEPLLIKRNFNGIKEDYWEISEEFRHYFNLYEDRRNNKFILIDDNGDDEDVILLSENTIKIKLRLIREFLAVKKMALALLFSIDRFSDKSIEELRLKDYSEDIKGKDFIYSIGVRIWNFSPNDPIKAHGFLLGKKIIYGIENFKPQLFNNEKKKYADYIIGIDDEGKEVSYTCDEDELSNSFGKNKGKPHFLTPVLFKKEVLSKYYSQPEKYTVEDGILRCGNLWSLQMDNNQPDCIMAFLGDLGHLSYKEQQYWRTFNISTEGRISRVAWSRGFAAKFTDPEKSDLFFKQRFTYFQKKWENKFGWKLFKPLKEEDQHHFKTLRIPLTEDQREFDEQVLSLTKLFIDSLNEKELSRELTKDVSGGLNKLEAFLIIHNFRSDKMFKFLRNLQSLRSSAIAHRKGKNYEKLKKYFSIGDKDLSKIFDDILIKCIWVLNTLENKIIYSNKK